ncbi:MAG TPA: MFS transporter [Planctomycetaceae bacterium]|jgi:MFS family permease|nr:MFS transporter [Planctomycetaceae bacterium]
MHDDADREEYPSSTYAWYVVALLTLAYVFSFIDRQILSLLVGPIRKDLGIGDKEMGLLMGATFAVFYTLFGIPLGRLADTRSRRGLIAIGIAFWSLMTAGCGITKKFWELALMRMGVGVGEATLSPSAYSLIADYFRPERRATAMSVYSMGIYVGSGMAFILGGMVVGFASGQESFVVPLIGAVRSWQVVFFVVGLPGLAVALLTLTIREPVRKGMRKSAGNQPPAFPLSEVLSYVWDNRATFLCLNFGVAMVTLNAYGATSWVPTFFVRRFGWTPQQTGMVFGLIVGLSGGLGIISGGWFSDWLNQRGHTDASPRVAWLAIMAWLPFGVAFPLAPTGPLAAALLVPALFFGSIPFGVAPAAIQQMMPNPMRAQATAIYLFVINLIGMGLGPTAVAVLTVDVFKDEKAVHHSLLVVGAIAHFTASILLWFSLRHYRESIDYLKNWSREQAAR